MNIAVRIMHIAMCMGVGDFHIASLSAGAWGVVLMVYVCVRRLCVCACKRVCVCVRARACVCVLCECQRARSSPKSHNMLHNKHVMK